MSWVRWQSLLTTVTNPLTDIYLHPLSRARQPYTVVYSITTIEHLSRTSVRNGDSDARAGPARTRVATDAGARRWRSTLVPEGRARGVPEEVIPLGNPQKSSEIPRTWVRFYVRF